jgi:hypothetical protein
VTQVITGCIGKAAMHRWSGVIAINPFGPGPDAAPRSSFGKATYKGREWCGWCATRHCVIFDVGADAMKMELHSFGDFLSLAKDEKIFPPRQNAGP